MHVPALHAERYARYAEMRAHTPVHFNSERQLWEVYGYHDIQAVLSDPIRFSSDTQRGAMKATIQTMATMDPPRHTQLRKLISRAFTSKLVADMEPSILAITNTLLDKAAQTGKIDLIADLAFPLPVTVIAELLGLPASDHGKFKHWSELAVQGAELAMQGREREPHMLEAVAQLTQYLEALAIERRERPGSDLISGLATAEVDGQHLSMQEVGNTCRLLLIAGFETTTNLIGNCLFLLLQHTESLAQLRANPQLFQSAIDEVTRYFTPFQILARIATEDVTLGGQTIQAGQQVVIFLGSGNRDATAFTDADRFDITRSPNRHLGFGHGIHYCLGAGLARIEVRVAIDTLLARFPDLSLDSTSLPDPLPSHALLGFRHIHARL